MPQSLLPRQPIPALDVALLSGARLSLTAGDAQHFTLLVFYRGYHCPLCRTYLSELNRLHDDFTARGVAVKVLSSDTQERARRATDEWSLDRLDLGYGLAEADARAWGLYISTGRGLTSTGVEEPARFSEPGIFLIRPDLTLYWANVQTMPFARPHFKDMLGAIDFVLAKDYPARGEA
ncbi:peroxiredoxin-like family protein [Azonexus sp.]|uniref:peroxiredoxin-like family protein n=1 Tax=Azonexus sp. TaxID=1872668 RepID=UPI0027BACF8F|nr:peroxiredoxin-like family protein [Azonexus sp.]